MTTILDIQTNTYFELGDNIQLNLEKFSPFEFTVGEISLPIKFPFTKKNIKIIDSIHNINTIVFPKTNREVIVNHNQYQRSGELTIKKVKKDSYIEGTIIFSSSVFYKNAHETQMEQIFDIERTEYSTAESWAEWFAKVMTGYGSDDFLVFEVLCKDILSNNTYARLNELSHYAVNPNRVVFGRLKHILQENTTINYDGEPLNITLLPGHNITPFLKLSYVLNKLFEYFGYSLDQSVLLATNHYQDLAVLNNTADTIVSGRLNYSMLVPTCSAAEFLKSISVILGCGFSFSGSTVKPVFYNEKYNPTPSSNPENLTPFLSSPLEVNFEQRKALVLSSKILTENLKFRIPLNQNPPTIFFDFLEQNFSTSSYTQFISNDGITYITIQQTNELARMRYALVNQFSWPTNYAYYGIDLSLSEALDATKTSNFDNFFDDSVKAHYGKITTLFNNQISDSLKIGDYEQTHTISSGHTSIPDITENLIELDKYLVFQDVEIFPKAYVGEVRRLNSRLSIEADQGGTKKECPIMFAFARKGVVMQPAQDPGTYIYAVHFYGSSTTNDILFDPVTEANEYIESSLNFAGWTGIFNRNYQKLAETLANSPIEVKAQMTLPLQKLDYIESGDSVIINGSLLMPLSIKYRFENDKAKVIEAIFRTIASYLSEEDIDEQALEQIILNQN